MSGQESQPGSSDGASKKKYNAWITSFLETNPDFVKKFDKAVASRDANAEKIVGWVEDSANATKKPGENLAHALSAHGPGTDQIPRLVSGRRADQVAEDAKQGNTPGETVELTGADGSKVTVPKWTTVGDDPSNVSSRFASGRDMLRTLEEAFAQMAQLDARIAEETKALDAKAMQDKDVQSAAKDLQTARKNADAARLAAKTAQEDAAKPADEETAQKKREALERALADLTLANKALDEATAAFRAAKQKVAPGASALGEQRTVLTVAPGGTVGEGFSVDGVALKSETKGDDGKMSPTPLTEQVMQERYATLKNQKDLTRAGVVLDPAYVEEFGQKRRAGWQVQTAFPMAEGEPQRALSADDYARLRDRERADLSLTPFKGDLADKERQVAELEEQRKQKKQEEEDLRAVQKALELRQSKLDPDYPFEDFAPGDEDKDVTSAEQRQSRFEEVSKQFEDNKQRLKEIQQEAEELAKLSPPLLNAVKVSKATLDQKTREADAAVAESGEEITQKALQRAQEEEAAVTKRLEEWRTLRDDSATPKEKHKELDDNIASALATVKNVRATLKAQLQQQVQAAAALEKLATEARDAASTAAVKAKQAITGIEQQAAEHAKTKPPAWGADRSGQRAKATFEKKAESFVSQKEKATKTSEDRDKQLAEAETVLLGAQEATAKAKLAVKALDEKAL